MHRPKRGDRISVQIKNLGVVTLISTLGISLVGTIWAIYFDGLFKSASTVGLINTLFQIFGTLALIIFIPLIEKNSKSRLLIIALFAYSVSYFLFSFLNSAHAAIILGVILALSASMRMNTVGIILRDKSKNDSVSKNTGIMFTLLNVSWLLGPIAAGFIADKFGINIVFMISGFLMLAAIFLMKIFKLKDNRKDKKIDRNLFKLTKEFFSKKKFRFVYLITGGISFWWAFIYLYVPIYIIESGKSDIVVGYFLSAIIAPLILLEFIFGKIAGRSGFRKMFLRGYLIVSLVAFLCFFAVDTYAILILLVIGSVGMAMLEPTTEAYFFDISSSYEKDRYYGIYNTTIDISYAISLFLVAILIKFVPFKYSFIFMGVVMGIYSLLSLRVKNIIEGKRC